MKMRPWKTLSQYNFRWCATQYANARDQSAASAHWKARSANPYIKIVKRMSSVVPKCSSFPNWSQADSIAQLGITDMNSIQILMSIQQLYLQLLDNKNHSETRKFKHQEEPRYFLISTLFGWRLASDWNKLWLNLFIAWYCLDISPRFYGQRNQAEWRGWWGVGMVCRRINDPQIAYQFKMQKNKI